MEGDLIVRDKRGDDYFTIEFNTQKLKNIFNQKDHLYKDKDVDLDLFKEKLTDEQVIFIIAMVTDCIIEVR